jgi:hypothetical protein
MANIISYRNTVIIEYLVFNFTRKGSCGIDCAAESQAHGTVTLLRCTLSAVVKSPSEKCMLHKYL